MNIYSYILVVVLIDPDLGWLKYIDGGPDRSGFRLAKIPIRPVEAG